MEWSESKREGRSGREVERGVRARGRGGQVERWRGE